MTRFQLVVLSLFCLAFSGCAAELYRAETRLNPDGSIERAISQPRDQVPLASRDKAANWQEVFLTQPVTKAPDKDRPIRALPKSLGPNPMPGTTKSQPPLNFVAWGKFASVKEIPDHFELKVNSEQQAGLGNKKGRLIRKLDRTELGFVTEWQWNETLADTIDLADHRLARTELAKEAVKLAIAIAAEAWGPEYDLKPLEQWLNTEATEIFHEALDLLLETGIQKGLKNFEENEIRFKAILKRHGFNGLDEQGKPIKDPEILRGRAQEYVTNLVRKLVKNRQGQPLSQEKLTDLLKTFGLLAEKDKPQPGSESETRLTKASVQVIQTKYGGSEPFFFEVQKLGIRIFGIYLWPILVPPRDFDYQMEFPGEVIKSNGELVSNRKVRWRFQAPDAFPLGYSMEATAVVTNEAAVQKFAPHLKLSTREEILAYLKLVRNQKELIAALNQLATGEAILWDAWLAERLKSPTESTREHAEQVKAMLEK